MNTSNPNPPSVNTTRANTPTAGAQQQQPAPRQPVQQREDIEVNVTEDWHTAGIISSINSLIREEDQLLPDGSNYGTWGDFLKERLSDAFNYPEYLSFESRSTIHERIARSILLHSVDRLLCHSLTRFKSAADMFYEIRTQFNSISRARQLGEFC